MEEIVQTFLIALIPAVISFAAAVIVERMQIKSLEDQNKHDIDKLMKQHEIDIDNLKEKHLLEMKVKEKDYQHQLELKQKEYDNELLIRQKESENAQAIEGIKGVFGVMGSALNTPEGQRIIGESLKKSQNKNK